MPFTRKRQLLKKHSEPIEGGGALNPQLQPSIGLLTRKVPKYWLFTLCVSLCFRVIFFATLFSLFYVLAFCNFLTTMMIITTTHPSLSDPSIIVLHDVLCYDCHFYGELMCNIRIPVTFVKFDYDYSCKLLSFGFHFRLYLTADVDFYFLLTSLSQAQSPRQGKQCLTN